MIKAREKGIDLSKYKHDLTDEEIDAAIKELNDAGVIDEVKVFQEALDGACIAEEAGR